MSSHAKHSLCLQAYSLHHGRPVSDADFQPRRTRYENTGQLQLLHRSYQYGTPNPLLGNARLSHTKTENVDMQELTQQLKVPLYKQLIGNTAMVDLSSLSANPQVDALPRKMLHNHKCASTKPERHVWNAVQTRSMVVQVKILGKCEFANPSGSIKDRIADHILNMAEQEGKLKPGGTVVAATSGNTGASVAMIAAMKGYKYIGAYSPSDPVIYKHLYMLPRQHTDIAAYSFLFGAAMEGSNMS